MTDTNKIKILVFLVVILGIFILTDSLTMAVVSGIIALVGCWDYGLDKKERKEITMLANCVWFVIGFALGMYCYSKFIK